MYVLCVCICRDTTFKKHKNKHTPIQSQSVKNYFCFFFVFYLNCISLRCAFQFVIVVGSFFSLGKIRLYKCVCFCSSSELCLSTTDSDWLQSLFNTYSLNTELLCCLFLQYILEFSWGWKIAYFDYWFPHITKIKGKTTEKTQ